MSNNHTGKDPVVEAYQASKAAAKQAIESWGTAELIELVTRLNAEAIEAHEQESRYMWLRALGANEFILAELMRRRRRGKNAQAN